jgi:ATP-dependent DNA helicase RecG
VAEKLRHDELKGIRVGVIHGRMATEEKDATMIAFGRGEIQALVATSVIEVGIDVPNVAVMSIEHAELFGLAQLHQLRGRVGRGVHAGFVGVFAEATTDAAKERIEAFLATDDGFEIAEADFRQRGAGELLGIRQHGPSLLRVADLANDQAVLKLAKSDAAAVLEEDPELKSQDWQLLRTRVIARFGDKMQLADIG